MEILRSSKAVATVGTALLVGSIFWLMNTRGVNSSLEAGLGKEKLKSESLLSEKLLLEKEIDRIKGQLSSLMGQNQQLDNLVKSTKNKLNEQEAGYLRMKKENTSLAQIKKQRQDLLALQHQLENELENLRVSYSELEFRNRELNTLVASLEERNQSLANDLNRAMFAAVDHSQLQATKGKAGKATVKARKTRKLIANFEAPANLKNLSFRIIDSKGSIMTQKNGTMAITSTPSDESYVASTDSAAGSGNQKIQMVFTPAEKLRTGLYTVEILNDNLYVASMKVKLN